ncbi:MAG: hypothetical protein CM15mP83_5390 [Flavobacteriaceae bacterium]|nr:MAG: hypothetical protein CM15mP83_5390 [Flavobacteriaceae bacterium]
MALPKELVHGLEFQKIPQPLVGNLLVELYLGSAINENIIYALFNNWDGNNNDENAGEFIEAICGCIMLKLNLDGLFEKLPDEPGGDLKGNAHLQYKEDRLGVSVKPDDEKLCTIGGQMFIKLKTLSMILYLQE